MPARRARRPESINAWTQLGAVSRLWTTTYGRVLVGKVLVVGVLVGLGALNRYVVIPRLDRRATRGWAERALSTVTARRARTTAGRGDPWPLRRSWRGTSAGEAGLAVAVFACTAVLGESTPGRHVSFERKPTSHVTNVQPRAGRRPFAAGDRDAAGRRCARADAPCSCRLKCFTCHAVDGERFPPAARTGTESQRCRAPSGRQPDRVDPESERDDRRRARLHRRSRALDHAGVSDTA